MIGQLRGISHLQMRRRCPFMNRRPLRARTVIVHISFCVGLEIKEVACFEVSYVLQRGQLVLRYLEGVIESGDRGKHVVEWTDHVFVASVVALMVRRDQHDYRPVFIK